MPVCVNDLRQELRALQATAHSHALRISAGLNPPFTPAWRQRILAEIDAVYGDLLRLRQACARSMMHMPEMTPAERSEFSGYGRHLAEWAEAVDIIGRIRPVRHSGRDLEAEPLLMAYERGFYHMHDHLCRKAMERASPEWGETFHRDIALPFTRFLDYALTARRLARALGKAGPLRFADIGCGVGLKLVQAAAVFEKVTGLEYEAHRAEQAADLMGRRAEVDCGDALVYDGYGRFDILYAFRPIADEDLMAEAERRMIDQTRAGVVLVMPYPDFEQRHQALGCVRIRDAIYVSGYAPAQIATALRLLPHVGTSLPTMRPIAEGFARPLRDALRRWGHLG